MGLNETPKSDRIHIAVFGKRNAGKSSLINGITGQKLSIVSNVPGTTTDPVYKAMELLPLGPVMMIDTPGLDDTGDLGELRIEKAVAVLNKADIAVLVMDVNDVFMDEPDFLFEIRILDLIKKKKISCVVVLNKTDMVSSWNKVKQKAFDIVSSLAGDFPIAAVSAETKERIYELKELLSKQVPAEDMKLKIVGDILEPGDFVVLVIPIDSAAPKGRLILPQQQTIRDVLEAGAISIVTRDVELSQTLRDLGKKPKIVITDSQAFAQVSKDTPEDIMLTSFSILFSRYKGDLRQQVEGVKRLDMLEEGARILIAEGCTHHRQCDDIGTVKLPRWIEQYTGKNFMYETTSGGEFPADLTKYDFIVHCGGCMLNNKEMQYRLQQAKEQEMPIANYGTLIAYMNGILQRTIQPFPEYCRILNK